MMKGSDFVDTRQENGIVYFNKPTTLDWLKFTFQHLDCNAIAIDNGDDDLRQTTLVAYASSREYNRVLERIFKERYQGGAYGLMVGVSEWEANGIA